MRRLAGWLGALRRPHARPTHNFAGTLDGLTLLDETIGTEKHDTDLAGLEVHAHALDAGGEPVARRQLPAFQVSLETKRGGAQLTRQAPQPGHWPDRAHGRYHHCGGVQVSVANSTLDTHPPDSMPSAPPHRRADRVSTSTCVSWSGGADASLVSAAKTPSLNPMFALKKTYPTDRTRPVSARLDSSWTPRMRCSRMDETSVGEALASAYVRAWMAETAGAAFRCRG